jgi:hypothetical protein
LPSTSAEDAPLPVDSTAQPNPAGTVPHVPTGATTATPVIPSSKALGKRPAERDSSEEPFRPRRSTTYSGRYARAAAEGDDDPDSPEDLDELQDYTADTQVQVGKPARKTRTTSEQNVISNSLVDIRTLADIEDDFTEVLDQFTDLDPALVHADRLRGYLAETSILHYVAPWKRAEASELLGSFLNTPVPPNAPAWTTSEPIASRQNNNASGHLVFFESNGTRVQTFIPYVQVPEGSTDFDTKIDAICDNVCSILQRWPYGAPNTDTIKVIVREVAHAVVGTTKIVNCPMWVKSSATVSARVYYIDPETRQSAIHEFEQTPSVMDLVDIDAINDVNALCRFTAGNARGISLVAQVDDGQGNMITPSQMPQGSELNALKVEKFLRYFSYRTNGQIVSEQGLVEQYYDLLRDLGARLMTPCKLSS